MKYSVVLMVVTVVLFGFFTTSTNGLSCYKCDLNDKKCGTEKNDANIPTYNCSASDSTETTTLSGTTVAAGETTAAPPALLKLESNVNVHKYKNSFQGIVDAKFYCYKVNVKSNDTISVVRGCKSTSNTDDCGKNSAEATYENCEVCDKDNCNGNGQSMLTGSAVQCALISCLLVAKMFLQAK